MYDEAKRLAQKVNEFKASLVKLMKLQRLLGCKIGYEKEFNLICKKMLYSIRLQSEFRLITAERVTSDHESKMQKNDRDFLALTEYSHGGIRASESLLFKIRNECFGDYLSLELIQNRLQIMGTEN